ncbi:cupin domain-containing protein [Streptomyces sp. NPDC007205]|uniref:cupin domain-containing protein n=1 Tax=Streptomyces sp. NPDC007205 TaxID=3154316 RepID=UPI0033E0AD75
MTRLARRARRGVLTTPQTDTLVEAVTAHYPQPQYDNCTFVLCRLELPPNSSTGWHYHPGTLIAIVEHGELHHRGPGGETRIYRAGDAFVEPSGPGYVHCGTAGPDLPTRLLALYITPKGHALTIPASAPE